MIAADQLYWFFGGVATGGLAGSLLTFKLTHQNRASHGSTIVDQSGAHAGGDNVAGNKTTLGDQNR
jgi:hypothetical protein